MSAAFALVSPGPAAPCSFPKCLLEAFHDGDHVLKRDRRFEFPGELPNEDNERLAALVTPYGVGTRSYNRSAEKRELDRQREEIAARHQNEPKREVMQPPMCACPQRPYPHELSVHKLLRQESYSPKLRQQWPWALCLSKQRELSTERE